MKTADIRQQFVFARPCNLEEIWPVEMGFNKDGDHLRFFAGFDKIGRVKTRHNLNGAHFFYEAPLLHARAEQLQHLGFTPRKVAVEMP